MTTSTQNDTMSLVEPPCWIKFKEFIESRSSPIAYANWIAPIRATQLTSGYLSLVVPNIFVKEYLLSNYSKTLHGFLPKDSDGGLAIVFEIETPKHNQRIHSSEGIFFQNVPAEFKSASIETCNLLNPEILKFGLQWAIEPRSIFLYSEKPGRGKTTFAFALIRELLRKNKIQNPLFESSSELEPELLQAIKSSDGDRKIINKIKDAELFFLDDLGRELKSDRLIRQYFEIINYRYSHKLLTLITSNMTIGEIAEQFDQAIASRLSQWEFIHLAGHEDLRQKT